jgi:spore maturation protein CgeB
MKILIAGESGNHCLETSYETAFKELGHEAVIFDTRKAVLQHARFGFVGRTLHRFFAVEAWLRKANKDLVNFAVQYKPDIIFAFTNAEILPGTFAYLKTRLNIKVAWYWADPLPSLNRYIHQSLPLTNLVCTYSNDTIEVFQQMGAQKAIWVPFAGDMAAHYAPATAIQHHPVDLSFVGSWRPEREKALSIIHKNFPALKIKIYGPYWKRVTDTSLKKFIVASPLYGKAFTDVVQQSLISLNVIDDTNYPAVNMRFFEIPAAGGLQLCSYSPETEKLFMDKKHVLYFANEKELVEKVQYALDNRTLLNEMRTEAQQLVVNEHLYKSRAATILSLVGR